MDTQFSWIPTYEAIARHLVQWEGRQAELIAFLERLRNDGLMVTPMNDKDAQGARFLLQEIDPFTFMGTFNRGIRKEQRLAILAEVLKFLGLALPLPTDFAGIPILNNQKSWLISYQPDRSKDDVPRLWQVFKLALEAQPLENPAFLKAFDSALEVRNTNINLTMGLFWIQPKIFLNLDNTNRQFLKIKLPSQGITSDFYVRTIHTISKLGKPLYELSLKAWDALTSDGTSTEADVTQDTEYWMVGSFWESSDPQDQSPRFLEEGVWENGYEDRYLEEVKSMKVGDKIAIKAAVTQKNGLPFDARGNTASKLIIKAVGTVIANRGDGTTIEVEWNPKFKQKDWYFYTNRTTVWKIPKSEEMGRALIDFAFFDKPQDYDWFVNEWYGSEAKEKKEMPDSPIAKDAYDIEDILDSGIFLSAQEIEAMLASLRSKKNLILQGAPGVGKTFLAQMLAFALMGEKAEKRVEFVQFHQSFSYEDFIRGYRPLPEKAGTFGLKDGVFLTFCQQALADPDNDYVFIIDEINRGNLSQIFGELLMLIEADKRDSKYGVKLVYRNETEGRVHIPANVYLIGLMNIADRSLAMVDYALRRRFTFSTLKPQFKADSFKQWFSRREINPDLLNLIVSRMTELNEEICADPLLGENYVIGHSYFCPAHADFKELDRNWFEKIIKTEISPLLHEYWFDNAARARELSDKLLRA